MQDAAVWKLLPCALWVVLAALIAEHSVYAHSSPASRLSNATASLARFDAVPVVLDMTPWVNRRARIYVRLSAGSDPLVHRGFSARWWTRDGILASGTAPAERRRLVFDGYVRTARLADVLDIEAHAPTPPLTLRLEFDAEVDGSSPVPLDAITPLGSGVIHAVRPTTIRPDWAPHPRTQRPDQTTPRLRSDIQPTANGIRAQAEWAGRRVAVNPEFSGQNGLSMGGVLASSVWRGALGFQFLIGAEKRDLLLVGGWQLSPATRLLVTAGELRQQLPMTFENGTEHVRMSQYAGGVAYQLVTGGVLERVDLTVHGSLSGSRDLGTEVVLRQSALERTLLRVPRRVAGGSIVGTDTRIAIRPHPSVRLTAQLGGEQLVYSLAGGRDSVRRLTTGAEWMQQLGSGFHLTAGGTSYSAQRTLALAVGRSFSNQEFGLTLTRLSGRDGAPSDTQVRWQHSFTWGNSGPPPSGGPTGSDGRHDAGRAMLDLVSSRPVFMPAQVVARIDNTVTPTRLVALMNEGLPSGARIDAVTAAVTLAEPVTEIVWLTCNGAPLANTGQFAVVNQQLEIRPSAMKVPDGIDTYVVTLENAERGITTVTVAVSAGSVRVDRITVNTDARRDTPDSVAFATQQPVSPNTLITSNPAPIAGLNVPVPIAVTDGEYAIDDQPFTTTAGQVVNGQSVRVRHRSAATTATTTTTVLAIGAARVTFSSVTEADTVPNTFAFGSATNAEPDDAVPSDTVTIRGIDGPAVVTISSGEYSIDGGPFTAGVGTILDGQTLQLRVRASSQYATTVTASVAVGGQTATFAVTTKEAPPPEPDPAPLPPDTTPASFAFAPQTQVAISTAVVSNAITVSGIDAETPISINGGQYAVNGGSYTSTAGTVVNGETVTVRLTSSSDFAATTAATLTIGGASATFTVTTRAADTTPGAFSFAARTNVEPSTAVTSNTITVSGIDGSAAISVSGGEYAVSGGGYTAAAGMVSNGQTVTMRLTSASGFAATTAATLTIGGASATFTVTTRAADTTPGAFSFAARTNVEPSTAVTSNTITVSGIDGSAAISVSGGEYAVSGGGYTAAAGMVSNGQTVTMRLTSASGFAATTAATLTIGGVSATFSVTTRPPDTTPDAFSFSSQTNVAVNTFVASNAITVSGIEAAAAISISGGAYAIDGAAFTQTAGSVTNGQTVTVRLRSANEFSTTSTVTLTIGSVSGTFRVTTASPDTTPDAFSFTPQTGVAVSTAITSNPFTITGINSPATITVTGGEYSTRGNSFTSGAGQISPGDTLRLRQTSSTSFSTTTTMTVTVGGVSATFSVTTEGADTTPDAFSLTPETNVNLNQTRTSNSITVSGINSPASISVSGAATSQYSVNNRAWVSAPGTVSNGDTVRVRHTSAPTNGTTSTTALTIGGVSGTFSTTTRP